MDSAPAAGMMGVMVFSAPADLSHYPLPPYYYSLVACATFSYNVPHLATAIQHTIYQGA
jgi:hypothetical protein